LDVRVSVGYFNLSCVFKRLFWIQGRVGEQKKFCQKIVWELHSL